MKTRPVVITTQPEQQAYRLMAPLEMAGIDVFNLPTIHIHFPRPGEKQKQLICRLNEFQLLIFTSRNGVSGFFRILEIITGEKRLPGHLRIAAIGAQTATEVQKYHPTVHFTGSGSTSDEFAAALKKEVIRSGERLLLVQGNLAPGKLQDTLLEISSVERIDVYETVLPDHFEVDILRKARDQKADLLVFTSPSAFRNFIKITEVEPDSLSMLVATIGKTTGDSVSSLGYRVDLVANCPDYNAFAAEIINYLNSN